MTFVLIQNLKKILDSIFINSFYLISSTFITSILGFIFWIIASRLSTPSEVGLTSILISSMNIIAYLSIFGFNISIIRYIPNSEKVFHLINSSFCCSIIGGLFFCFIFIYGVNIWSPVLSTYFSYKINCITYIIFTEAWIFTTLLSSIFIGNRYGNLVFFKETIFGSSKLILLFPLIILQGYGIFFSWGLGITISVIAGLFFFYHIYPNYSLKPLFDINVIKEIFVYSFSNYFSWLFSSLPIYGLPIMISAILSTTDSAYFYISWMISNLLFTIPTQISQAFFAEVSHNEVSLKTNFIKSIKISLPIILIGIIIFVFFGDKILLLFGQSYSINSYLLLQILALSVFPYTINTLFLSIEKVHKKNLSIISISATIAIITLIGSFVSLKDFGIIGAGLSWFLANLIVAILLIIINTRKFELVFLRDMQKL